MTGRYDGEFEVGETIEHDNVEHSKPVFHGDTIRVRLTVTIRVEASKTASGPADDAASDGATTVEDPLARSFDRTVLSLKGPDR